MKIILAALLLIAAGFYFVETQISVACLGAAFFIYLYSKPPMSFGRWFILFGDEFEEDRDGY